MRKRELVRVFGIGIALLLLGTSPARAVDEPLYIGYELPRNADLAGDSLALESRCLNARDTVNQACANGANQSECRQQAEISFRRCIASIPGTRFWLAGKATPDTASVDPLFPLTADEATDPDLNPVMDQLRSAGRYYLTGVFARAEPDSCSLLRSSDGEGISYRNEYLCQSVQDYLFFRKGLPVLALRDIPLLVAITRNQYSLVWALLEREGLDKSTGAEAAECANRINDSDSWHAMIRLLVDHGLDVNTTLPVIGRSSLLDNAVYRDDMAMLRYLLEKGADPTKGGALSAAIVKGNPEMVHFLIKDGADVNELGGAPLALAAGKGNLALVKLLVANGARIDAFPGESFIYVMPHPALIEAVKGNHLEVAKWLLEQGASVDIADQDGPGNASRAIDRETAYYEVDLGWPAMVYALKNGNAAMVKLLLRHGAFLGGKGATTAGGPVWWAVKSGRIDIVKELLAHGANINECANVNGMCNPTPLQEAARKGDLAMARFLISRGADVNAEGEAIGASPVWVAETCHHGEVAGYLKKHGGAWGVRLNFDEGHFRCE